MGSQEETFMSLHVEFQGQITCFHALSSLKPIFFTYFSLWIYITTLSVNKLLVNGGLLYSPHQINIEAMPTLSACEGQFLSFGSIWHQEHSFPQLITGKEGFQAND